MESIWLYSSAGHDRCIHHLTSRPKEAQVIQRAVPPPSLDSAKCITRRRPSKRLCACLHRMVGSYGFLSPTKRDAAQPWTSTSRQFQRRRTQWHNGVKSLGRATYPAPVPWRHLRLGSTTMPVACLLPKPQHRAFVHQSDASAICLPVEQKQPHPSLVAYLVGNGGGGTLPVYPITSCIRFPLSRTPDM
jgi:hypothetical protein